MTRPETAPSLLAAVIPGAVVALVSGRPGTTGPPLGEPCGTTQLAVWCAESLWWSRDVDLLAWVSATSRASLLAGYVQAAVAVGVDPGGTAEQVAAGFTAWLRQAARPWLVVLDGLRDPGDLDGLWPSGPAGQVVITAPDQQVVASQPQVEVLPVGAFSPREAMKYLMGRLSTDPDQRHGAIGLTAELGCQPLALAQASATIATSIVSCADYQDRFNRRRARLAGPGRGRPVVGEVTWLLSADQAERLAPGGAAWLLLALTAVLGGDAIPAAVFIAPATCRYLAAAGAPADADAGKAWDAVLALERTGLVVIGADSEPAMVWISPAVAARIQAATPEELSAQVVKAAADALLEAWPEAPQPWLAASLRSCAATLQHAARDRLWAAGEAHPLLLRTGQSMDDARLTGPAASYWAELTATSERMHGPDSATLALGSRLARALLAAGHTSEAVTWSKWVITGETHTHGPDHPGALAARVFLGHALTAAGRHSQAITVLEEVTADYDRIHGPGHLETIGARDDTAAACQAAGRADEAIGHYQRNLADREALFGPGHPATITARENLAGACLADGRFAEALAHYQHALADREALSGPDHLDTIAAHATIAAAHQAAGDFGAALALSEQVCADYQRILGPAHPHTLGGRASLAHAYRAAGRLSDAATLLRETLTRCEQVLPPGHPLIRELRDDLSGTVPPAT